jgi:hypothetical protein
LKRLLDVSDRNRSTGGPTACWLDDDDDDDDNNNNNNDNGDDVW